MRKIAAIAALSLAGLLSAASAQGQAPKLGIEAVSAPAKFVSGEQVLIRVAGGEGPVQVLLNGKPATVAFASFEAGMNDGLVQGLKAGANTIQVKAGNQSATLAVTSHDPKQPVISGPHVQPFICQSANFRLPDGTMLGAATDADCSVPTKVQYVYKAKGSNTLSPLADPSRPPANADEATTLSGAKVPFIVRVETGGINRAVYQFAVLHNPAADGPVSPAHPPKGWSRKLIAVHGTGCARGWYIQGQAMGVSPLDAQRLGEGFAVFTSTLNHPTNSCNAVVAAESTLRVRERVIQTLGAPAYTLSMGGSGGAYTSLQIADAYPGLIDGVLTNSTFPDALAIAAQGLDGHLLNRYFRELAPGKFTPEQIQAVGGYGSPSGLRGNGNQAGRTDPVMGRKDEQGYASGVWNDAVAMNLRYDPKTNPKGARPTVFDVAANVYGKDPKTGFGLRPFDNVGVQYGLGALNDGRISVAQFLDMNAKVGGYDNDANYVSARSVGNPAAIARAYQGGLMLSGSGGLASLPMLDYTGIYSDLAPNGDYHMKHHHFEVRERLKRWNGNSDNMVMWSGPERPAAAAGGRGAPPTEAPTNGISGQMGRDAFTAMDAWMSAIARDKSAGSRIEKTLRNKPRSLVDGCYAVQGQGSRFIAEPQVSNTNDTACNRLYPVHAAPRLVAGGPRSSDVLKCVLKTPARGDYKATFSDAEWRALNAAFPSGVCDWTKPGVGQQKVKPWSVW